jgi:hypothetical protein
MACLTAFSTTSQRPTLARWCAWRFGERFRPWSQFQRRILNVLALDAAARAALQPVSSARLRPTFTGDAEHPTGRPPMSFWTHPWISVGMP